MLIRTWILLFVFGIAAKGQALNTVPGFDPTPISISPISTNDSRLITPQDLVSMRDFVGARISPNGKHVAFVVTQPVLETNSYRSGLFVVATEPGAVPTNLGTVGPPRWDDYGQVGGAPQWSPDSRSITYLTSKSGTLQIWKWRLIEGEPQQLTRNGGDVQEYEWSADGTKIVFVRRDAADVEQAKAKAEEGILWDGSIQASRGKPVMNWVLDSLPRKTHLWIYELETETEREATANEEATYKQSHAPLNGIPFSRYKVAPDKSAVAYSTTIFDAKKYKYQAVVLNLQRKSESAVSQLTPLMPAPLYYIQDFWWKGDSQEIYFNQAVGAKSNLYAVPVTGGPQRDITKTEDLIHTCSFDQAKILAACIRENATTPPELVRVDTRDGSVLLLAQINPEFRNIKLSPATKREWTNKYGDPAFGHLIKPIDYQPGKRYPLIVTTYRSKGFLKGGVGDEYPVQLFAANGFAVLSFDASTNRPDDDDFNTNMLRWNSPLATLDLAIKQLDDLGITDPNRRAITGLSYGADITEFVITHSDLFQAAATSGASGRDPLFYYLSGNGGAKLFKTWVGGWPGGAAAPRWRELSPALNAEKTQAALLINATEREYLGGLQLYTALKELRKPVELVIYPDEGHVKNQPKHRYQIYLRNLDWFRFWLQNSEDPDPAKKQQYERWRAMRANSQTKF